MKALASQQIRGNWATLITAWGIAPFITQQKYCNAACDRFLARLGGWAEVGERMRWPYRSIPPREAERIRPIAWELLPEFFMP